VKDSASGLSFEVWRGSEKVGDFKTPLSGEYNLLNATAAIGLSALLGISISQIQMALETFKGVKRRQEILGEPRGILVIEDFAHHPTAVRETIAGIKSRYPLRKIFAVFEPRSSTSRQRVFQKDYVGAFQNAEKVFLAKAFDQSKIEECNRFSSQELVSDLRATHKWAYDFDTVEEIVAEIQKEAKAGDLVLIMSNGGFDDIYSKLLKALSL
jgi:UDP-N-acetylmuramate: L-alanyl-gamma-D-glutamyl-meso-diaminopimelate ligase